MGGGRRQGLVFLGRARPAGAGGAERFLYPLEARLLALELGLL
jgi:hypothetical protein